MKEPRGFGTTLALGRSKSIILRQRKKLNRDGLKLSKSQLQDPGKNWGRELFGQKERRGVIKISKSRQGEGVQRKDDS